MGAALGSGYIGLEAGAQQAYVSGFTSGGSCSRSLPGLPRASSNSAFGVAIPVNQAAVAQPATGDLWQALDVRHASFLRAYNVSASGSLASVREREYVSWIEPGLLVREVNVTLLQGAGMQVPVTCSWGQGGAGANWGRLAGGFAGNVTKMEDPTAPPARVVTLSDCSTTTLHVGSGSSTTASLLVLGAIVTSLRSPSTSNLTAEAERVMSQARTKGAQALWSEHATAWEARWDQGHIEIVPEEPKETGFESSPGLQTTGLPLRESVNGSLYDILVSLRSDWPLGISPGGISTDGYNSNRFWDEDTWVLPGLTLLHRDDVALSVAAYRADPRRLASARRKAAAWGHSGAAYPWQSGESGLELQCGPWGEYEIHISADVALAMVQLWAAQGGSNSSVAQAWLRSVAWPVLNGTAEFWLSRVSPLTGDLGPGIEAVSALTGSSSLAPGVPLTVAGCMPPDEYHYPINSSAYTNVMAALNLAAAAAAARALGEEGQSAMQWSDAASRLVVLFNASNGVHPEFQGWTDGDTAKQADVVLLGYPVEWKGYDTATKLLADLDYYAAHTTSSGPAMTWGVFVNGYLDAGEPETARSFFNRSYANVQLPYYVWSETPSGGCPHFVTGAGGWLQTLLSGYGGLRIPHVDSANQTGLTGALRWRPQGPPPGSKAMVLHGVDVGSCALRLEVSNSSMAASVLGDSSEQRQCQQPPSLRTAGGTLHSLPVSLSLQDVWLVPAV